MNITENIRPKDIKQGDQLIGDDGAHWTAIEDAQRVAEGALFDHGYVFKVRYRDGGVEPRFWSIEDAETAELRVVRLPKVKAAMLAHYEQARAAFDDVAANIGDPDRVEKLDRIAEALGDLKAAIDAVDNDGRAPA